MNIFEAASRNKLRFETSKGSLSVEDLWDMPLSSARETGFGLDDLAISLHREIKAATDAPVSFVTQSAKPSASATTRVLRFDVIKHIIDVRIAERDAGTEAGIKRAQKQRLREVLERRQNAEIELKSPAEIQAMIDAL